MGHVVVSRVNPRAFNIGVNTVSSQIGIFVS